MKRILRWRPSRKQLLVSVGITVALLVISIFIGGYHFNWDWVGVGNYIVPKSDSQEFHSAKTLWDWMQLLIVPAVLAGGALLFNKLNTETQNGIAEENQREVALLSYVDRMSELLLEKGLRESKENAEIRNVARTRTLGILRRLDKERKGLVVRFLQDAKLIGNSEAEQATPVIALKDADLSGANLRYINLSGADLRNANVRSTDLFDAKLNSAKLSGADLRNAALFHSNLSGADLRNANLNNASMCVANLTGANLTGADLTGADLTGADLTGADLTGANLTDGYLTGARLTNANLTDADLTDADLTDARLTNANLTGAEITKAQLAQAKSLQSEILPNV